jgi:hypothetical protein
LRGDTAPTAKTAPPKPAPQPEQKPEPPPKPAVHEEPKVEEKPLPDTLALPDPTKKPKEEKKQPPPKKKEKEEPVDPLASVLKNLAAMKTESSRKIEGAKPDEEVNDGESPEGTSKGFGPALADRLTISQEDALRRQIGGCWNMPIGARNAEDLIVEVLIEMNEDRTVRSAEIVDKGRLASDSHFRAAAEAALRALRHPKCTPLALPEDQYEQWKTIRFNFDPRDML